MPRGVLLLLLLASMPSIMLAQAQTPAHDPVTAFVHVAVVPMDRERVLQDQTVVVRGDRIIALGPASRVSVPVEAVRVDGQGKFLLPGLADMHVHLAAWGGDIGNHDGVPSNVADILMAFVANGVTTVRDLHSGGPTSQKLAVRRRVQAGELLGPRIYTAADPDISSPEAAAANVPALKAAGHDFLKVYAWSDQALYDSVAAAAARVGLPLVGHPPVDQSSDAPLPFARLAADHWSSIEHSAGYFQWATGVAQPFVKPELQVDDSVVHRLAVATRRAGVWNCPTLALLVAVLSGNEKNGTAITFHRRLVKALQDVGAGLLLGTDTPQGADLPGFAIHRELEALVEAGLTPYEALVTGTRNVARFLGTEDSTGTVAVGKRADLVLLKANPLVDIHHTAALAGVMVGGHWLPRRELDERLWAVKPADAGSGDRPTFDVQLRLARSWLWR